MRYTNKPNNTMFFRPKFCVNCGEKVERVDWGLFTSRRFCQVCESEFKGQDLLMRLILGLCVLFGVFGFGSYLKSGRYVANESRPAEVQRLITAATPAKPANIPTKTTETENPPSISKAMTALPVASQPQKANVVTKESRYFCGAETKKGTPCSRRVKGNFRCFQHIGMPAMLPAGKLKIE